MNPFGWLVNLFRRGDDPRRQVRYVLPYQVSGLNLTPDEMLSLSAVWACTDIIARAIGSCRLNVFQPAGKGRRERLDSDMLAWILNTRPNPEMTAIGFREAMLFQAIPFGNAYAEIVRNQAGRVAELWPLISDRMIPMRRNDWGLEYQYLQPDGTRIAFQPNQIFHLRGPGLYGLMGDNLVARAAKSISVAAAQERYAASFFGQGAQPSFTLEYPAKLGDEQYRRLKEDWNEKKKGPENAHKPMILESGMKANVIGVDPEKAQMTQSRQFSVEEIARWFGVPLHKIQHLLHATFSNIEHQSIEFVRDAVTPWCLRITQEADAKLIRQDRAPFRYTEFDTRPLLAGDAKSRAEAYASGRQNGWLTANEIRAFEGLDDAGDDGDILLVQSNLTTVQKILEPPKPPPVPGLPGLPPGAPAPADPNEDLDLDPDVEPARDPGGDGAQDSAREALVLVLGMALDRYARRLKNRRRDLERRAHAQPLQPEQLDALLDKERAEFVPKLLAELEPASAHARRVLGREFTEEDLRAATALVDGGEAPNAAAARSLPASCPRHESTSVA